MRRVLPEHSNGLSLDFAKRLAQLPEAEAVQTYALPLRRANHVTRVRRREAARRRRGATQPVLDALPRRRPQCLRGSPGKRTPKRSMRLGMLAGSISSA